MKHISIGRQYGSCGRIIGKKVAEKLGITYYDNQILNKAAEKLGVSVSELESLDEKGKASIIQTVFSNGVPMSSGTPYPPGLDIPYYFNITTSDKLFELQSKVIKEMASKGDSVFVGRCSDFVLKDADILNVFINAPLEVRAKNIAHRYQISEKEAEKRIKKIDKKRNKYYNYFTSKSWGNVDSYHITIDSARFDHDVIVDLIIDAYKKL